MRKKLAIMLCLGIFIYPRVFKAFENESITDYQEAQVSSEKLRKVALEILNSKCNVCHRKRNPFMVFKESNMSKRAKKIYRAVFVEQRMPKGSRIKLTKKEYLSLEEWLLTEEIF